VNVIELPAEGPLSSRSPGAQWRPVQSGADVARYVLCGGPRLGRSGFRHGMAGRRL